MSHNNQKKIAIINDLSGFGRCSLTVAMPIISHLKIQSCPVPTSILSNHTGFEEYFFDDYTDNMQAYINHWKKLDLNFEGIATGFLGSAEQIEIVKTFIKDFKTDSTVVIIDPVMGDNGSMYTTYTKEMCNRMEQLLAYADIITPNVTEACILTGVTYCEEGFRKRQIEDMALHLSNKGPKKVVITGIKQGGFIANYVYEAGTAGRFLRSYRVGEERSGTGDIFSSIISADAVNGVPFDLSIRKASRFIKKCILKSIELNIPKTDGVCFEEVLSYLK